MPFFQTRSEPPATGNAHGACGRSCRHQRRSRRPLLCLRPGANRITITATTQDRDGA
jgi:hypothetical protein